MCECVCTQLCDRTKREARIQRKKCTIGKNTNKHTHTQIRLKTCVCVWCARLWCLVKSCGMLVVAIVRKLFREVFEEEIFNCLAALRSRVELVCLYTRRA